jgi:stage II sporulation protein D
MTCQQLLVLVFILTPTFFTNSAQENLINQEKTTTQNVMVRVLLDELLLTNSKLSWKIASTVPTAGIRMYDPALAHKRYIIEATEIDFIYQPKHGWTVKNRIIPFSTLCIEAVEGELKLDGILYPGKITLHKNEESIYLINQVPLETYVESVLHTESWPGWPLEVNKAFAIASRSYVVAKLNNRTATGLFDIKCTNKHQTYSGACNKEKLKEAVLQTKGIILTHNKKPIEAMFDACCGGIIPGHIEGIVNFKQAPYLQRTTKCTFCSDSKIATWNFSCSLSEFEEKLKENGIKLAGKIQKIVINKKDKAGLVQSIRVATSKKTEFSLAARSLYSWFKPIKSNCYTIEQKGKTIAFKGRGYGHHFGICQWGARKMIDFGKNFISILTYYYPGTTFASLAVG